MDYYRHMVDGLCDGGADVGPATLPRREWYRSAGGNHQSSWHAFPRTNQDDEPQLHGTQVPADQTSPIQQGPGGITGHTLSDGIL